MTKKKYIYLTAMVAVVNFVSYFFIRDINIWAMVTSLLLGIFFIYTSYLLLLKKSYNLLAGMTEEELERIQENIEVKMKYDKGLKIIGYIIFIGGDSSFISRFKLFILVEKIIIHKEKRVEKRKSHINMV
ncbi:hypothetical protein HMPREF1983_00241 [Gemella bergeri ATCC 700627]|uniref:Uncharacterized protein n=1 Tax=Gemella bergeri ATCC 700627 TaxID=1321820 RepID=U2QUN2_9BACL|nr:hypothetical protein [Gemella bergeri]ERK60251.1 hypothetical protein HMPREF1983_00241 [Gemella bergeri ATCC 700627]